MMHSYVESIEDQKSQIKLVRSKPDREGGLVQLTGRDLQVGQTVFPNRTPADPMHFVESTTGEVHVYGTQVEGTGFSYLKYNSKADLLRGAEPQLISKEIFLPNGQLAHGKEVIWDAYRLSYETLLEVFPKESVDTSFRERGIDPGSDLFYGGIALREDGTLGRWTIDNWRRRIHPIAQIGGKLTIQKVPVFNEIKTGASEDEYPGFGLQSFLPGDYIGHTYGPNFKLVQNAGQLELWIIKEEVTRRVEDMGVSAEVTEIVGRQMLNPFQASKESVLLVSPFDKEGKPHIDACRGPEMGYAKLLEGFRPMRLTPGGLRITKRLVDLGDRIEMVEDLSLANQEYFLMTGSQGNFAGDTYDVLLAFRKGDPIGRYEIKQMPDGKSWKKYLFAVKEKYRLSWAGRADFVEFENKWWLLFHAVDKDLKPDGSYSGVIPADTHAYHRNLYVIPIEFYIDLQGEPDMLVLLR